MRGKRLSASSHPLPAVSFQLRITLSAGAREKRRFAAMFSGHKRTFPRLRTLAPCPDPDAERVRVGQRVVEIKNRSVLCSRPSQSLRPQHPTARNGEREVSRTDVRRVAGGLIERETYQAASFGSVAAGAGGGQQLAVEIERRAVEALAYSRLRVAMWRTETPAGQAASHSLVLVQLPKPLRPIWRPSQGRGGRVRVRLGSWAGARPWRRRTAWRWRFCRLQHRPPQADADGGVEGAFLDVLGDRQAVGFGSWPVRTET